MVDILKMGSTSLLNLQQALSTTGHNITNVNTDGYSKQTVEFRANESQVFGYGHVGQGSSIASVDRAYDDFLTSQSQKFTSSQSRYDTFVELSSRVDDIMANSENNLSSSIQKFFSSVQEVSSSPSTLPERQALIGEAGNLVDRQQSFSSLLQDLNSEVNSGLRSVVTEINGLTSSIALLNKDIVSATASANGGQPNDLLDQRDRLVKQLSEKVSVTTIMQDDGALNIFAGKGQALVVGSETTQLKTQNNPYDSSRLEIAVEGQTTSSISQFLNGGEIEGLLDFRSRVLLPAQTKLGLVALGIQETVNAQHALGMDLNGDLGTEFFKSSALDVAAHQNNAGSAVPVATLTDVKDLRATDYLLAYDGSQWQLTRTSDNTSVAGAGPLVLDGMSIDVSSGTPTTGDSYVLNPARLGGLNFELATSDARKIAAASPLILDQNITNAGNSTMTEVNVVAGNSLPLAGPITLTFNPDALGAGVPGFDVTGGPGGTIAYNPATESNGKVFNFSDFSFTIGDTPVAGDTFEIANNTGSFGDNSNILKIGELQYQTTLNGSKDNYQQFYGSMVAEIGVVNRQAQASLEVETSLLNQANSYRDSASGVNLDEEAANLLRYQQQYQAAAQLVKVADEMFQTLMGSIR